MLALAAALALGPAEAAMEQFKERLTERVLAYSLGDRQREQRAAQVRLATAMSDLASTRVRWEALLRWLIVSAATRLS